MTKRDLFSAYTFLGQNIKMTALSDSDGRLEVIRFLRALRKIVSPILDELKVVEEPAFTGDKKAIDSATEEIFNSLYDGEVPKIKSDYLMDAIIKSEIDIPVIAVLNSFDAFLED